MAKKSVQASATKQISLVEYSLIATILLLLGVVVFVALSPVTRFQNSRDARRYSDVNAIFTALNEYAADHGGELPPELVVAGHELVELGPVGCETSCEQATGCVDLSQPLAPYLQTIPVDPQVTASTISAYTIKVGTGSELTVTACEAENRSIQVKK